ncbi:MULTISPECIES: hypothetical protein [unclassified Rhodococcus (in: high G+C Gram-positive bacteria)]|uniref:hypothetical protein n=1 Tax=unclassified Rhodococcus (in: high G+C Gram-positive bacteria) TaxID=192944 RepID=UPI00114079EB|nr:MULTISPECIES: hypothetical protein [unclassified Rhodococcus (in: high G+C Gram-positive bacteria)]
MSLTAAVEQPAWWSQRVAAEGSTASEGIRRQLGKPKLDPLTVLIREAAQNSCDAALPGHDVEFKVQIRKLTGKRLAGWRGFLLPGPDGGGLGLKEALDREATILIISDRGTTGLGGPLRADEPPLDGERADFVKFIRNVGERKGVDLGGGSYGFGKGILYNVSRCHVIVADSQCVFRGKPQRRLIGAAMGDGFQHDGVRYTGRHWLGVQEGEIAQALIGDEAERMASSLGLPSFAPGQTGTTVAIVDVDLGAVRNGDNEEPRTPEGAADYIASTMLWNLWPRMIDGDNNRLRCSVKFEGFPVDIPDPARTIELKPFVDAYRKLSRAGEYDVPVRKAKPQEIGRFAMVESMAPITKSYLMSLAAPFSGSAHHCARMRQADLVVDYVAGEPHPNEAVQYGAVFKAGVDADSYFSDAEPPTHDDWVTSGLHGAALGVVRLGARFLKSNLKPSVPDIDPELHHEAALAPLAGRLSGLVAGASADGAGLSEGSGSRRSGRSGGRSAAKPKIVDGPALVVVNGEALVTATIELPLWPTSKTVTAEPLVVIEGGTEQPGTLEPPVVLGWADAANGEQRVGRSISVAREDSRKWTVSIRPPKDAVVRIALTVEDEG